MKERPVYGIADLHLGAASGYSMKKFGPPWDAHPGNLFSSFRSTVPADAITLIPGDVTIGFDKQNVLEEYRNIDALPGDKIVSPGNHDRAIWKTNTAARKLLADMGSVRSLKNSWERVAVGDGCPGMVVAAVRGALGRGDKSFAGAEDAMHEQRETVRLEMVLRKAREALCPGDSLVLMIHYPPFDNGSQTNGFGDRIQAAGVDLCVYGHIHNPHQWRESFQGRRDKTHYRLLSADYLGMVPRKLARLTSQGLIVLKQS